MCSVSTPGDLREGYGELWSALPSWAVRAWRFHRLLDVCAKRSVRKTHISLCKHAVWLEPVEKGSIQAVPWVTAFILLHYLQEQFWQVQQMGRYDTLLKSLIKHNAVKTISSPFLFTHFPWCILHQFFHCTRHDPSHMSISLCVLSISQILHFNHSHECIFTFHIELRWGMQVPVLGGNWCNLDYIIRFQNLSTCNYIIF